MQLWVQNEQVSSIIIKFPLVESSLPHRATGKYVSVYRYIRQDATHATISELK